MNAIYIFFRGKTWYPTRFTSDAEAIANAETNPGTTKVESFGGNLIWEAKIKAKVKES
ncbi:MAG: hypothetical protein KGI54_15745 [Pseudomonadota bacterium]|nr:hypothetical protein [Pseudomonadota bacterium]